MKKTPARTPKGKFPIILGALVGMAVILLGIFFVKKSHKSLPSPVQLSSTTTEVAQANPVVFHITSSTPWISVKGKIYPYSFSYPETLPLVAFINDPIDAIAINWNDIRPQNNILSNVEFLDYNSRKFIGKYQDYVKNYWTFFSGLKGLASMQQFSNSQGLQGFKAHYTDRNGQSSTEHVFFIMPGDNKIMLHFANGILDQAVFDRIIDSVTYTKVVAAPLPS